VTQLVMGSLLFPLFKIIYDDDSEKAWRTVCVIPAVVAFGIGLCIYFFSDDAPKGNYNELKKNGNMPEVSAAASFRSGAVNFNTWLLFVQYACCFGVELTMNNAAALYFKDEFEQSTESAAAIASIFGWMNLFARGLGGFASDYANARMGMRGRLIVHTIFLLIEGALVLVFAQTKSLSGAIIVMVFFSLNVQAAEGTTFGIVPYVDPPSTGSISGIVGAGGNCGAVAFGMCFRQLSYKSAFMIMGFTILGSGIISLFINIKGHAGLVFGKDTPVAKTTTLAVPDQDEEEIDA
jgi:NNP family nitrate/nitrite transporter-like MFS transporter